MYVSLTSKSDMRKLLFLRSLKNNKVSGQIDKRRSLYIDERKCGMTYSKQFNEMVRVCNIVSTCDLHIEKFPTTHEAYLVELVYCLKNGTLAYGSGFDCSGNDGC